MAGCLVRDVLCEPVLSGALWLAWLPVKVLERLLCQLGAKGVVRAPVHPAQGRLVGDAVLLEEGVPHLEVLQAVDEHRREALDLLDGPAHVLEKELELGLERLARHHHELWLLGHECADVAEPGRLEKLDLRGRGRKVGRSARWRRGGPRVAGCRLQARLQLDVGPRCRQEPRVLGDSCAQLVGPHQT
eukprot:scaffold97515_cov63-Phaeocystis_antarctica.AAC.1